MKLTASLRSYHTCLCMGDKIRAQTSPKFGVLYLFYFAARLTHFTFTSDWSDVGRSFALLLLCWNCDLQVLDSFGCGTWKPCNHIGELALLYSTGNAEATPAMSLNSSSKCFSVSCLFRYSQLQIWIKCTFESRFRPHAIIKMWEVLCNRQHRSVTVWGAADSLHGNALIWKYGFKRQAMSSVLSSLFHVS